MSNSNSDESLREMTREILKEGKIERPDVVDYVTTCMDALEKISVRAKEDKQRIRIIQHNLKKIKRKCKEYERDKE